MSFKIGDRVLVSDAFLYNDSTPSSETFKPATIVNVYKSQSNVLGYNCGDVIDVKFDHREGISKAHLVSFVQKIER